MFMYTYRYRYIDIDIDVDIQHFDEKGTRFGILSRAQRTGVSIS